MMPGLSGWETYDIIKKNEEWAHIPILFLTARTDDFAKRSCMFLGDDYIEKPFEVGDLLNRIEQAIDRVKQGS
jgi:DNA-binding response OmpR family regulator